MNITDVSIDMHTFLSITAFGLTAVGGVWAFLKYMDGKLNELKDFVMNELKMIDQRYVLKDQYVEDRQLFLDQLKEIRTDVCSSISHLTERLDTLFTNLVKKI